MSYSEWNEVKLSDIAQYVSDKIETSMINKDNYISTENMLPNKGGVTIATNLPNTKKVNSSLKGDILISNIRPYFKKIWYCDYPCGVSTDVLIIRTKDNRIYNKFLYYFLSQDKFFDFMVGTSKGTKMPRGDKNAIMSYQFKLPPLKEQKLIAKLFELIDEKIKLNNEMNKTLEEIAQSIFKHWFVDFEFPNENGEPYKSSGGKFVESELGMIPKGWKIGNFGDFIKIQNGFAFKSKDFLDNGENAIIKIKNISGGLVDINNTQYISSEIANKVEDKFLIKGADLLIAMTGAEIGKVGLVPYTKSKLYLNQRVGKFVEKIPGGKSFIYNLIKQTTVQEQIKNIASGSAQPNISGREIERIPSIVPPSSIIERFSQIMNNIIESLARNYTQNNTLFTIRETLLPKLMSGEIRIPEAEEAVESCLQKSN